MFKMLKDSEAYSAQSLFGGEREIRTLGRVLAATRFPVVRLRPAQPSLQAKEILPSELKIVNFY